MGTEDSILTGSFKRLHFALVVVVIWVTVWGAFGKLYADSELEKRTEDYDYYRQHLSKTKNEEFILACPLFGDEKTGQKRICNEMKYEKYEEKFWNEIWSFYYDVYFDGNHIFEIKIENNHSNPINSENIYLFDSSQLSVLRFKNENELRIGTLMTSEYKRPWGIYSLPFPLTNIIIAGFLCFNTKCKTRTGQNGSAQAVLGATWAGMSTFGVLAEITVLIYKFYDQHLGLGMVQRAIIIYNSEMPLIDKNSRTLIGHLSLLFVFIGLLGEFIILLSVTACYISGCKKSGKINNNCIFDYKRIVASVRPTPTKEPEKGSNTSECTTSSSA